MPSKHTGRAHGHFSDWFAVQRYQRDTPLLAETTTPGDADVLCTVPRPAVVAIVMSVRGIAPLNGSSSRSVVVELIRSPPYGYRMLPVGAAGTHVRMLPTLEQAAPQPSTRSLIDQGEPLGLRLPRIALPLAQAFPSASLSTRPLIGSGPHCFHDGIGSGSN